MSLVLLKGGPRDGEYYNVNEGNEVEFLVMTEIDPVATRNAPTAVDPFNRILYRRTTENPFIYQFVEK